MAVPIWQQNSGRQRVKRKSVKYLNFTHSVMTETSHSSCSAVSAAVCHVTSGCKHWPRRAAGVVVLRPYPVEMIDSR